MNMDEITLAQDEKILAYLRGELNEEQEKSFMAELNEDASLKERAIAMAHLAKASKEVGKQRDLELRDAFLTVDEDTVSKIARNTTKGTNAAVVANKRVRFVKVMSMAASVLLFVFLGFQYRNYSNTTSLGDEFASPFNPTEYAKGEVNENIEKELGVLIGNVYSDKDLSKTLARLAVLWEVSTLESYNDYTDYAPEIGWALATGYLKDNKKDDAENVLAKMEKTYAKDTNIGKQVRELRSKLAEL